MVWVRGATVGRGSFATVSLAFVHDGGESQLPKLMAVKSAPLSQSSFLQHEESILTRLQHCPYIIRCFSHDLAAGFDAREQSYNLFLEYASGGTLSDLVRRSGGSFPETTVRRFTRSLLEGLRSIHAEGYVHCDIKLQNILVQSDGDVRIADFGLAKKTGDKVDDCPRLRGTPIYMSPESVTRNEYEEPADIWSLGCAVAEMASGRPAWRFSGDGDVWALLLRIGFGDELPEIPAELSDEGKDFLRRCFAKDTEKRWTAEMLLGHPFVADSRSFDDDDDAECCTPVRSSPKGILDFSQWVSPASPSLSTCAAASLESLTPSPGGCCYASPTERIGDLATGQGRPEWSCFSSVGFWIDVRQVGFVPKLEDSS
ncbi:mitogen-activated protein kinase kinase kinase 20-like [Elaeis guineensis]|uniref:Mitogen-activated protein kinase kinase kinase 18-like n=1 Tax=Elaeis guineensis var. tenera TaxID=51953 RepID=A0A6I9RHS4_ELAGV|nr:mitogen-activated protein kinase kinase kinase 18-like [Elaeis guineensis]